MVICPLRFFPSFYFTPVGCAWLYIALTKVHRKCIVKAGDNLVVFYKKKNRGKKTSKRFFLSKKSRRHIWPLKTPVVVKWELVFFSPSFYLPAPISWLKYHAQRLAFIATTFGARICCFLPTVCAACLCVCVCVEISSRALHILKQQRNI